MNSRRIITVNDKTCATCKWYTEDAEVCVNDASDHLADFVLPGDGCEGWEEKER